MSPRVANSIDWLIDYLQIYVPLKNLSLIWRRHHCRWRAVNLGLCLAFRAFSRAGRDLDRATPAVTLGLGFSDLIRRTAPFSRLLRHTRGCGGPILTRILMGLPELQPKGEFQLVYDVSWHLNSTQLTLLTTRVSRIAICRSFSNIPHVSVFKGWMWLVGVFYKGVRTNLGIFTLLTRVAVEVAPCKRALGWMSITLCRIIRRLWHVYM
jgi:hypothetical protein